MNEIPPEKIRLLAVYFHLAGLIWLPISIAIAVLAFSIVNQGYLLFFIGLFVMPIIGMLLASLLIYLIWRVNRPIHSFVDLSGRSIINFMLSTCLYLIVLFTLTGMTCGLPFINQNLIITIWLSTTWGILPLLLFGHFCFVITGAIHGWKGRLYSYPLAIKFLNQVP